MPNRVSAGRLARLLALGLLVLGCREVTGPRVTAPPGRQLLDAQVVCAWTWLPAGQEILYSTPAGSGAFYGCPTAGQPTRLDAIDVATGRSRVVVSGLANSDWIVPDRFTVVGQHVYFQALRFDPYNTALYRAALDGLSAPEVVIDSVEPSVVVSPDERTLAWLAPDGRTVVTEDLSSQARRSYQLQEWATRIVWSPDAQSLIIDQGDTFSSSGIPIQWLDLTSGALRVWVSPGDDITIESSRTYRWEGDTPFLYIGGPSVLARYSVATGVREVLATLPTTATAVGWTPDYESAVVATNTCLDVSTGIFGGDCLRWASSVDRVAWRSGARTPVLRHEGRGEILGRISPTGDRLAYEYHSCGCYVPGDGLYVVPVP